MENHPAEIKHSADAISQLQNSLTKIKADHAALREEWSTYSNRLTEEINLLHAAANETRKQYAALDQARQNRIQKQKKLLRRYKLASFVYRLKEFLRPRLGVLYQYDMPRKLYIPKKYENPVLLSNNPPLISIVTPSFNQGPFLEETMLSVINQEYPALEYIIQDGASNDNTLQIIERYKSSLKHWESTKDQGQSQALNLGFHHATGDIMAYLNSDDLLLPGTLHYVAQYFAKHPEVDVVYGHRVLIDIKNQEIGRWILPRHDDKALTWADYIPQETLFWRRSIWDKAGGYIDENFKFAMDWELLLRFQKAGARFYRLPRFLGAFRVHPQQKTSANMSDVGEIEMKRLRMRSHGREVYPSEINKNIRGFLLQHVLYHKLYRLKLLRH